MSEIDSRYSAGYVAGMEAGKILLAPELAALRTKLEEVRGILAGPDAGSLPNDYPLERMAANRMEERNKFMWQVRDTCTRAEEAERKLAEAYRVRRFNIREAGDELFICKDNHEKYEPCVEQHYVPVERLAQARAEGMEEAARQAGPLYLDTWHDHYDAGFDAGVKALEDAIRAKMKEQK